MKNKLSTLLISVAFIFSGATHARESLVTPEFYTMRVEATLIKDSKSVTVLDTPIAATGKEHYYSETTFLLSKDVEVMTVARDTKENSYLHSCTPISRELESKIKCSQKNYISGLEIKVNNERQVSIEITELKEMSKFTLGDTSIELPQTQSIRYATYLNSNCETHQTSQTFSLTPGTSVLLNLKAQKICS